MWRQINLKLSKHVTERVGVIKVEERKVPHPTDIVEDLKSGLADNEED